MGVIRDFWTFSEISEITLDRAGFGLYIVDKFEL
jgi:hypothetical protein